MTTQKQLYGIAIFEDEIVLQDLTGSGEQRYLITPEQLAAFVRSTITLRPYPGLIWMKSDLESETHLLTIPAGPRTILYRPLYKGKKKDGQAKLQNHQLTLPAIAARVKLDNGSIRTIELWGMNTATLKTGTRLYELPLPNITGSSLCLGSTIRTSQGDIRSAVIRTIFDTPFNHHNNIVGREKIDFLAYLKKHHGRSPLNTLKPLGTGKQLLEAR
jgi:hypothetical protein